MNRDADQPLDRSKQLMLLMTQHQRRIFGYIYTLVPDRHAAKSVPGRNCSNFSQTTRLVSWRMSSASARYGTSVKM